MAQASEWQMWQKTPCLVALWLTGQARQATRRK